MSVKVSGIKVNESDLLCKNKCGYYGNPSWHYYCSVCYRNVYLKKDKGSGVTNDMTQTSLNSFSKFEEKRKSITSKTPNTIKYILKNTKEADIKCDTYDSESAKIRFDQVMSKFKKPLVTDINKQLKIHLDALEEAKYVKIEHHSDLVQKFYERLHERILSESPYKGLTDEQAETLMSEVERYLTVQIYEWAFKPNISDDEARDLQLQKKIRSLHWISPDILGAQIDEENESEKPHFEEALSAMIEMNTLICPQDKLQCIVRCCKAVIDTIQAHKTSKSTNKTDSTVVNADDFLPCLIYVIIRANPTLLHSNIQFIVRFARPCRINTGEDGYMFTNISIAVEFINNLTHKSLDMSLEEFEDAMRGIRPRSSTKLNDSSQESSGSTSKETLAAMFNGLRVLDNNEMIFKKLFEKADILENNLIQLEDEIEASGESTRQKIQSVQSSIPLSFTVDYWGDLAHDSELARSRIDSTTIHNVQSQTTTEDPLTAIPTSSISSLPPPINPIRTPSISSNQQQQLNKEQLDFFLK